MAPLSEDLIWHRNAPEPTPYTLTDDLGAAVNLTGYGFRLQVRLYPGAVGDPVIDLGMAASGAPGFYLDNAAAGQFTLTPPTSATLQAINPPPDVTTGMVAFSYDILLVHPDAVLEPFMAGNLILLSGVTR